MANTLFDRTIAFASICQSVQLVQDIARRGTCDNDAFKATLHSITVTHPSSTLAIFGSEANLTLGLTALINELSGGQNASELTRYLINLLALERKLSSRRDSLAQLGERIATINRQLLHFDLLDDQMISNLASIYLETISPLGPRIQVVGNPAQLQQTNVQHKIRAVLLAGIRSAVLWRQVGGRRRHLFFSRKQLVEQAREILARNA